MGELRRASEIRQVELTDAALHIIATDGIAALSTRRLAEHVGLSTGAIFRHFASLDALLRAVVDRVEAVLEATYPPPELPPIARLERFVEARTVAVGKQMGILCLVQSEQFLLALPRGGSEQLAACVEKTRAFVTRCLRDGQRAGEVRDDLSADALAPIVMGTMQMLVRGSAIAGDRGPQPQRVRETLLTLLRRPAASSRRRRSS